MIIPLQISVLLNLPSLSEGMVNNEGQLYTIEGIAAGIMMVVTAYIILSSTYILTPGDTHINDMQLEQLGNDVLKMMDTRDAYDSNALNIYDAKQSLLESYISSFNPNLITIDPDDPTPGFIQYFKQYSDDPRLQLSANVYYRSGEEVKSKQFLPSPSDNREHFVTVTRWVYIDPPADAWLDDPGDDPGPKTVLLEVSLWRD
jgi:hypothetical protein